MRGEGGFVFSKEIFCILTPPHNTHTHLPLVCLQAWTRQAFSILTWAVPATSPEVPKASC